MRTIKHMILFCLLWVFMGGFVYATEDATEGNDKMVQSIQVQASFTKKYGVEFSLQAMTDGDGSLSYTSADESIVQVNEEGLVTTVGVGSASIWITAAETELYQEASVEVVVTVRTTMSTPQITTVTNGPSGLVVAWEAVEKAEQYQLYRKLYGAEWEYLTTVAADILTFTDKTPKEGSYYYYRITACLEGGKNESACSSAVGYRRLLTPTVKTEAMCTGNKVTWTHVVGAKGYYLYRRLQNKSTWEIVAELSASDTHYYIDTAVSNGKTYVYAMEAYHKASISGMGAEATQLRLKAPVMKSWKRMENQAMQLTWSKLSHVTGYQIQYASNRFFYGRKTVTIKDATKTSWTSAVLKSSKTYFVRMRAYYKENGTTYYSAWRTCNLACKQGYATIRQIKYKTQSYELREQTGQKLYQYDTVQGGCTDGTYAYYAMYNRTVEKCKIAKIRLSDMKVMKVSAVLNLDHGNDMAYNPHTNQIVVVNCEVHTNRLTIVNPVTLKIVKYVDVAFPEELAGASQSTLKKEDGFSAITYESNRRQYALTLRGIYDVVLLNENFEVVSYINLTQLGGGTYQGMDCTEEYLLLAQSPKTSSYNSIVVYDWNGQFITKLHIRAWYEIENIFHVGRQFYATFYRSYYQTYKTSSGTTARKLMRDNYIYQVDIDKEYIDLKTCVQVPTSPYKVSLYSREKAILVKWTKDEDATGYQIYRATSKKGTYQKVKTMTSGTAVRFVDANVKANKTYYYKIRSYKTVAGKKIYGAWTTIKGKKSA